MRVRMDDTVKIAGYMNTNVRGSGIKAKVENKHQYEEYLKELQSVREELGVHLKENMYPEAS